MSGVSLLLFLDVVAGADLRQESLAAMSWGRAPATHLNLSFGWAANHLGCSRPELTVAKNATVRVLTVGASKYL